jgi:catechol 2,3-dioxygenase-like lactoylglutathione lyase family enzyme
MPITGIDHIMLAVPDLATAAENLKRALGLVMNRQATHPDFGTANRTIRIPGLYLELITIVDPQLARKWDVGQRIEEVCNDGGGLLAFVLGAKDLPATAEKLVAAGLPIDAPVGASGNRNDGSPIRTFWIAGYGEEFRTGRMPSLIEYGQPGEVDPHPPDLGYSLRGLVRVDVALDDFSDGVDRYTVLLGRRPVLDFDELLGVPTAEFGLPDGRKVRLLGSGVASRQGLFGIALGVADLDEAVRATTERGIGLKETGIGGELLLEPSATLNARVTLLAAGGEVLDTEGESRAVRSHRPG